MFCSAHRSRREFVAETFLLDEIQVHIVCVVSFIDIFRVDELRGGFNDENESKIIISKFLSEPNHPFENSVRIT